jgi:hypothetical protein
VPDGADGGVAAVDAFELGLELEPPQPQTAADVSPIRPAAFN